MVPGALLELVVGSRTAPAWCLDGQSGCRAKWLACLHSRIVSVRIKKSLLQAAQDTEEVVSYGKSSISESKNVRLVTLCNTIFISDKLVLFSSSRHCRLIENVL